MNELMNKQTNEWIPSYITHPSFPAEWQKKTGSCVRMLVLLLLSKTKMIKNCLTKKTNNNNNN